MDHATVVMRLLAAALVGAALLGCTNAPLSSPSGIPTPSPTDGASSPTPATPPSPSATLGRPSPTPMQTTAVSPPASFGVPTASAPGSGEPLPLEIVRWHLVEDAIHIELFNPNYGVGLLRAEFRITVKDEDGQVFAVLGLSGLPGTPASTILQLPPRGTYGLVDFLPGRAPPVSMLELSLVPGQWMDWPDVNPPLVVVAEYALGAAGFRPRVTGEVEILDGEGAFNVWLMAFIDGDDDFIVADGVVNCVAPGASAPFQLDALSDFAAGTVTRIEAYVTTVPGVPGSADGLDAPPGC
jgi:hypothetical protein